MPQPAAPLWEQGSGPAPSPLDASADAFPPGPEAPPSLASRDRITHRPHTDSLDAAPRGNRPPGSGAPLDSDGGPEATPGCEGQGVLSGLYGWTLRPQDSGMGGGGILSWTKPFDPLRIPAWGMILRRMRALVSLLY